MNQNTQEFIYVTICLIVSTLGQYFSSSDITAQSISDNLNEKKKKQLS